MPKGFIENVRKGGADQLIDYRSDEGQTDGPHTVNDAVRESIEVRSSRSTEHITYMHLQPAQFVHSDVYFKRGAMAAQTSNTGGLAVVVEGHVPITLAIDRRTQYLAIKGVPAF